MERDDIFRAALGGGTSWDERMAASAEQHLISVRESQESAVLELMPVLKRLARRYGEAAALGTLQKCSQALQQWARHHREEVA
jgi:hypothetical protein